MLFRSTVDGAVVLGERAREAVAGLPFDLGDQAIAVTVSVGCASATDDAPERLVERADAALYASKHGGRNKVTAG